MTRGELEILIKRSVRGLSRYFEPEDYNTAIDDAEIDTGFSLPTSTAFQIKWLKERTKRHLFFLLYSESAYKFKVKQFNLQHRFQHFDKLITRMDKDFEKVLNEEMFQFAGAQPVQAFGHRIAPGFAYDSITGKDITYESRNKAKINPSDTE